MIWTSLIAQAKRRLWMSLFIAILVSLVYFHFARFYQGTAYSWMFAVGWVPVLLNLLRAGLGLAYRLDRHPFRVLDLGLSSDQAAPGGAFEIEIKAKARRQMELLELSSELRCTRVKSTDRGRQRNVIQSHEKRLEERFAMVVDEEKSYRASLQVPKDAPYSFRSMEGKISWTIHIELEVQGWGALADELEVTVAPA